MIITTEFLKQHGACIPGMNYVTEHGYVGLDRIEFINRLIADDKLSWANWLIVRTMEYKQYVAYAVFAAEQVIDIYEKKYPGDNRARAAIEIAKKCIENDSEENKNAAVDAAAAADAAYAYAAAEAAYAAAAYAAAAYAAVTYAAVTYATYADAVAAADKNLRLKILNYGLSLIQNE